ncbi:MAG: hypothetical protein M3Y48_11645 [Actinomycetota bacterium]|nr:hypothetical protein [Actinomycetota bacterium]
MAAARQNSFAAATLGTARSIQHGVPADHGSERMGMPDAKNPDEEQ